MIPAALHADVTRSRLAPSEGARLRFPRLRSLAASLFIVGVAILAWPARFGGDLALVMVAGDSMEPTYSAGDIALSVRADNYKVGDVLVYKIPEPHSAAGYLVIHRATGRHDDGWVTQGDNRNYPDHWYPTENEILGRVVVVVPGLGRFILGMINPLGLAALGALAVGLSFWPDAPCVNLGCDAKEGRHHPECPKNGDAAADTSPPVKASA